MQDGCTAQLGTEICFAEHSVAELSLVDQLGLEEVGGRAQEVAHFAAECEKYVGTQSGGMDQAISIMGQAGVAKLISFNPVRHHLHGT